MKNELFSLHADIEQRHWWFVARREIIRRIIETYGNLSPGDLVVDVGCGTGANIASVPADLTRVGIDTSDDAIARAMERFPDVRFMKGVAPDDLGELAHRARLFLLMDVIEHVADDFLLVSKLLAAMKPGARLLITVPADMSLWSEHDVSFGHYRRYDDDRLRAVWSGLAVHERLLSYYNARLYRVVKTIRALNRRFGRTSGQFGTDFALPPAAVNRLLTGIFAGEARRLVANRSGYAAGVSLVALIERGEGPLHPRTRPDFIEPDQFTPAAPVAAHR